MILCLCEEIEAHIHIRNSKIDFGWFEQIEKSTLVKLPVSKMRKVLFS